MPSPSSPLLAALLLACLLPVASATQAQIALSSGDPVDLDGWVVARAHGTAFRVIAPSVTGVVHLSHVNGTLRVYTWDSLQVPPPSPIPDPPPKEEIYTLADAEVNVTLSNEALALVAAVASDGEVSVRGRVHATGSPVPLDLEYAPSPSTPLRPYQVPWSWQRGWLFAGDMSTDGFPVWSDPEASLRGTIALALQGGNLSTVDANGTPVRAALGPQEETPIPGGALHHYVLHAARLDGEVGDARVPVAGSWGFAAPDVTWTLEGTVAWAHATGESTVDGRSAAFSDASVVVTGAMDVDVRSGALSGTVAPWRYGATGDASEVRIDGRPVASAPPRGVPPIVQGAGALAILLVLGRILGEPVLRFAGAFYTRIARADVLESPRRRRIVDLARESPGIHVRELQRRSGMSWGVFTTHLHTLVAAKHMTLARSGRYRLAYATAAEDAPRAPWIPNARARALHALVTAAGAPVPIAECRSRLGISRQLLDHHARRLSEQGLLLVSVDPQTGERLLAPAPQTLAPKS